MSETEERISNELLYEVLKSIQAQVSVTREDVEMIKLRTSSIEKRTGDILSDIGGQNTRLDRMELNLRQLEARMSTHEAFTNGEALH